jgi:pimeloyl-ACP methyl ester carboxylesterase
VKRFLPKLHEVQRGQPAGGGKRQIVVFIHGIFSSHETFNYLLAAFTSDGDFDGYDLATYDYDWGKPIQKSAERLRELLNSPRIPADAEVTLICHSMGGLVARFAVMGGDLKCVKRIVMLGTPNFGAMRASQMSTLWQLAVAGAGKITPFFPRKAGLRDLTRVQSLYLDAVEHERISPARADEVDYVTVPGLYYYSDRRNTDPGRSRAALVFSIGKLSIEAITFLSGTQIGIEVPNDGVVEESSVNLVSQKAGQLSEKSAGVEQPALFGVTCAHVTPRSAYDDTHVAIQSDPSVASVIKAIMRERSIVDWHKTLTKDDFRNTRVEIPKP